jgi:hypothetical protein
MLNPLNSPLLVLVVSLFIFWSCTWIGAWFRTRHRDTTADSHNDFTFIVGGALFCIRAPPPGVSHDSCSFRLCLCHDGE